MVIQIAVLAWIFLDESPGAAGVAGLMLVSAGVFLAQAAGRVRRGRLEGR
jgi:drug/metabolite transporter (DMT)-like permease